MFHPHRAICVRCQATKMIVVKKGFCGQCNDIEKRAKKIAAGKRVKEYRYTRKPTGELALFEALLAARGRKSEISGVMLNGFDVRWFSHILTKAAYPKYRLYDKNIVIKTADEHIMWETQKHKLKDLPEWDWVFEREQELKQSYHQISTLNEKTTLQK